MSRLQRRLNEMHRSKWLACLRWERWYSYWSEVTLLSHVWLFVTPWTVAYQVPPSIGFSRQKYWSGLPFPSPGELPNPGIEPGLPHCRQMLYHLSHQGSLLVGKGLDLMNAWRTVDKGLWHCTGGSDQDHPQEKEMQKGKMVVWEGLTNSWVKKRS